MKVARDAFVGVWNSPNLPLYLFLGYQAVNAVLDRMGLWSATLPCLWKFVVNQRCPGFGLTRASLALLLDFDLAAAWAYNPLVFVVVPVIIGTGIGDVRRILAPPPLP